jgi:hypothetical protein
MFLVILSGSEYFLKVSVYVSILLTSQKTLSDRGRAPLAYVVIGQFSHGVRSYMTGKLRPHVAFSGEMM